MAAQRREAEGFVALLDDAVLDEIRDALAAKGRKRRDVERIIEKLCTTLIDGQWAEAIWLVEHRATEALKVKKSQAKRAIGRARGLLLGGGDFVDPDSIRKKYPKFYEQRRRQTGVLWPIEFEAVDRELKKAEVRLDAQLAAQQRKLREREAKRRKFVYDGVDILVAEGLKPGRAAEFIAKLCGDDALGQFCERVRPRLKAAQRLVTYEVKLRDKAGISEIARQTLSLSNIDAVLTAPLSEREAELRDDLRRARIPLEGLEDLAKVLDAEVHALDRARVNVPSVTTMAYNRQRKARS